jgi:hypothetical protein
LEKIMPENYFLYAQFGLFILPLSWRCLHLPHPEVVDAVCGLLRELVDTVKTLCREKGS